MEEISLWHKWRCEESLSGPWVLELSSLLHVCPSVEDSESGPLSSLEFRQNNVASIWKHNFLPHFIAHFNIHP